MTVANTNVKATYVGNGSNDTFAISFDFRENSVVVVTVDGVTQTEGVHYNISGSNVVFVAPPADQTSVVVKRVSPKTQPDNYTNNTPFPGETVEERLDKIVHLIQEVNDLVSSGILKDPASAIATLSLPLEEANKYIRWNATATALENAISSIPVWVTGTIYAENDAVIYEKNIYVCQVAHTAAADFETDLNNSRWAQPLGLRGPAGPNGNDGLNGGVGPQGPIGPTGATGAPGANGVFSQIALQSEAEAGVDNTKGMTPLRTKQAIDAQFTTGQAGYDALQSQINTNATNISNNTGRISILEAIIPTQAFSAGGLNITNNQAAAADIDPVPAPDGTGFALEFNGNFYRSIEIFVEIFRRDDAEDRLAVVELVAHFYSGAWYLARRSTTLLQGNIDGITFNIDNRAGSIGMIQYTSDNMAGGNYAGRFRYYLKQVPTGV